MSVSNMVLYLFLLVPLVFPAILFQLNVDIYLATIIVFVGRIFNNLGIIRRYYLNILAEKAAKRKDGKIPEKVDVPDNDAEKEVQE